MKVSIGEYYVFKHITRGTLNNLFYNHSDVRWLLETTNPNNTDWIQSGCKLAVHINVNAGMFVSKDQLAELNRNSTVSVINHLGNILTNVF